MSGLCRHSQKSGEFFPAADGTTSMILPHVDPTIYAPSPEGITEHAVWPLGRDFLHTARDADHGFENWQLIVEAHKELQILIGEHSKENVSVFGG